MHQQGPKKYMFLAGIKQILGCYQLTIFFTPLYVYFTYTVRIHLSVFFGLHFLHMPFSRLHVQQYEQAIILGQSAYTI